jgi:transposase
MWTRANRAKMAAIEKKTKRYPTDLTDEEWERVEPFLPSPARRGRKPSVDPREVLNAIRYIARAGCGWRMLPKDFPPWQTVYWWFRRFMRRLLFETIHDVALMIDRERADRDASPSAGVIDSQSVKAPGGASAGLRCRQENQRAQAPHCGGYGRTAAHGQSDDSRCFRLRGRAAYSRRHPQALAVGQTSLR